MDNAKVMLRVKADDGVKEKQDAAFLDTETNPDVEKTAILFHGDPGPLRYAEGLHFLNARFAVLLTIGGGGPLQGCILQRTPCVAIHRNYYHKVVVKQCVIRWIKKCMQDPKDTRFYRVHPRRVPSPEESMEEEVTMEQGPQTPLRTMHRHLSHPDSPTAAMVSSTTVSMP